MPKMTDRERLADLEARQRKMVEEVEKTRHALRGKYAAIVPELGVETLTEREFRDILTHTIRVGGAASIAALKALPESTDHHKPPAKRVPATSMA
ncbi:hypothetical protein EBBID32_6860 [Sphingobium indicum BiD32]|uniref:Mobilization protein n=2 Tax=Sphingobium indicum TaxID=332055 RepID=N1MGK4_9SPHN|nr:hypothetical protein EBBID32_6860 [Sphingobium indicum BiD32]